MKKKPAKRKSDMRIIWPIVKQIDAESKARGEFGFTVAELVERTGIPLWVCTNISGHLKEKKKIEHSLVPRTVFGKRIQAVGYRLLLILFCLRAASGQIESAGIVKAGNGFGSCILVEKRAEVCPQDAGLVYGRVVTAWHVVETAKDWEVNESGLRPTDVSVRILHRESKARLIAFDPDQDIALVSAWVPVGCIAITPSSQPPSPGARLFIWSARYEDGIYNILERSVTASSQSTDHDFMANGRVWLGESGGGILVEENRKKHLVSIVSGGLNVYDLEGKHKEIGPIVGPGSLKLLSFLRSNDGNDTGNNGNTARTGQAAIPGASSK